MSIASSPHVSGGQITVQCMGACDMSACSKSADCHGLLVTRHVHACLTGGVCGGTLDMVVAEVDS